MYNWSQELPRTVKRNNRRVKKKHNKWEFSTYVWDEKKKVKDAPISQWLVEKYKNL